MRIRDIGLGVIGLIVGIMIGTALVTADLVRVYTGAGVQTDFYYLMDLQAVAEWLKTTPPGDVADNREILTAIDNTLALPPWRRVWDVFPDTESSIQMTLQTVYQGIVAEPFKDPQRALESGIQVCLGLDDDPYRTAGPGTYIYVTVPAARSRDVHIPNGWQVLDRPKNSMFWLLLSCYPNQPA